MSPELSAESVVGWTWNIYYDGYPWTWSDDDQQTLKTWPTKEQAADDARREWGEDADFQLIRIALLDGRAR